MHVNYGNQYYAHPELDKAAQELCGKTSPTDRLVLTIPGSVEEIIRQEGFYCRAPQIDAPSVIAVYGASIVSLLNKGAHVDFVAQQASRSMRVPIVMPDIAELSPVSSEDACEVELNEIASGVVSAYSRENGVSSAASFVNLVNVVNLLGVHDRLGRSFCVYTERDPRLALATRSM